MGNLDMTEKDSGVFVFGYGEMSELVRGFDWASTPLGPMATWPHALRIAVNAMLANPFPIMMWLGREALQVYNDAARPIVGNKHPSGFGLPYWVSLPELRAFIDPKLNRVWETSESELFESQPFMTDRGGYPEEIHVVQSYSPVLLETGKSAASR